MKILLCFGTRPEAIKMAPIVQKLAEGNFDFEICVTAQHREMLDQVLNFFQIKPSYDLDIMKPDQSLNKLSSHILHALDEILFKAQPDVVLVQGDTTTAFTAALAAFNRRIKIGHVEAGLRTFDTSQPFPEEANRQLITRLANFHFAPTESALKNLTVEGISKNKAILTGNTIVDALEIAKDALKAGYENSHIKFLKEHIKPDKKILLVTGHRRENFGQGIEELCKALLKISTRNDVQIVFPVHLNPEVKNLVYERLGSKKNILLVEPVNYPALIWLLSICHLVISDSGGIQEEAPSFGKHVLVTRKTSERTEGLEAGFASLTGVSMENIVEASTRILDQPVDKEFRKNPYGDGKASERIITFLKSLNEKV